MTKRRTTPKVEIPNFVLPLVMDRRALKGDHDIAVRLLSPGDSQKLTMLLQREMEGIFAAYLGSIHLGVTQYSMRAAGARRTVTEASHSDSARSAEPTWAVFDISFMAELPADLAEGDTVEISSKAIV